MSSFQDGMTALMSAVKNGHRHVVEYLIDKGAEVTTKNFYNGTALTIARVTGHRELEDLLDPYFPEELTSDPYLLVMYKSYYAALKVYKRFLRNVRHYTGLAPTEEMTEDEL